MSARRAVGWESSHLIPVLIPVHNARGEVVDVCARADEQQEDEEEGLEVEEGGLWHR